MKLIKHKNTNTISIYLVGALIFLTQFIFSQNSNIKIKPITSVIIGAQQFDKYIPKLKNKRVGIITNITGVIGNISIVDTLIKLNVNVKVIFGPEHGFRSNSEAGEKVKSNIDSKTGLRIISLYGSNKKPTKKQLKNIDVLIYDIQDVGVRFYTYISTMCYAMEACAENNKEFIVLDRPNPNGFYIDGPVLENNFKSFLGLHHVPIVYGMTCGEYAQMANSEGWLKNQVKCNLSIVNLINYDRSASYELPVKPSPNIPNSDAVILYPSLGLFEGTIISLGRGTLFPFQVVGHPKYSNSLFSFSPKASIISQEPKYLNQICFGLDLRKDTYITSHPMKLNLIWIKKLYLDLNQFDFFNDNFNYHAGNSILKEQIKNNVTEEEIRKSWQNDIETFKKIRKKYLFYLDF